MDAFPRQFGAGNMKKLLIRADDILRGQFQIVQDESTAKAVFYITLLLFIFGTFYGAVMGSFGGILGQRIWQVIISGVKVPMLLLCTFVISLPSYFVINTLFGLRGDFKYAMLALLATQAGHTIILSSFAPLTAFWYVSCSNYRAAILFNALIFGSATLAAQLILRRLFQPLIQRDKRHIWPLRAWLVTYIFVGIQMGWVLRPFIGSPSMPPQFFREGAWGNAYVTIVNIFLSLIRG
jgi:hypothetical protein